MKIIPNWENYYKKGFWRWQNPCSNFGSDNQSLSLLYVLEVFLVSFNARRLTENKTIFSSNLYQSLYSTDVELTISPIFRATLFLLVYSILIRTSLKNSKSNLIGKASVFVVSELAKGQSISKGNCSVFNSPKKRTWKC